MISIVIHTMPNETIQTAQPEEWRINVNDAWQVLWWCRYLGITKTQLEGAIETVGTAVGDIKQYLAVQH